MVIVYADDEPAARRTVCRALQNRGHTVFTLNTGQINNLQADAARLQKHVRAGLKVDVLILDGHNLLTDEQGQFVIDMTPLGILDWLRQNGLIYNCRHILYSNDNQMVYQALQQTTPQFAAALCKVGEGGGLQALLDSVEQLENEQITALDAPSSGS